MYVYHDICMYVLSAKKNTTNNKHYKYKKNKQHVHLKIVQRQKSALNELNVMKRLKQSNESKQKIEIKNKNKKQLIKQAIDIRKQST